MKKYFIIGLSIIIAILAIGGGALWYHKKEMILLEDKLRSEIELEQEAKRIIEEEMNLKIEENNDLQNNLKIVKDMLDKYIVAPVIKIDCKTLKDSVKSVGELATKEYAYTNIGSIDEHDNVKIFVDTGIPWPFTHKRAIVSMDGKIKVGIDIEKLDIQVNENTRWITVKLPKAKILSNELDENSAKVYDETTELFSRITIEDSGKIRKEIKRLAEQYVKESNIYSEAEDQAIFVIRNILESVPYVKDYYKIKFEIEIK